MDQPATLPLDPNPDPDLDESLQSEASLGYNRVSPDTASAIIRIKRANPKIEGKDIAALLGIHPSTVSRWLRVLDTDTVPEARKLMRSQALRATMKIVDQVDHTDPRVSQGAAKSIIATAGVAEPAPVQIGIRVVVGQPGAPAGPDPFDAPVVVAEVSSAIK